MADPLFDRRRRSRRRARRNLILADTPGGFEGLEPRLLMATDIWTGASTDTNNWTDAANWQGNTAPTAGDDLDFPIGVSNKTTNNNFAAGTNFGSIEIDDPGYTLGGNGIHLGGSLIATYSSGTSTISADLGLAACTVNVASGGNLALTGNLTDRDVDTIGGITKEGIGTLTLSGNNSYSDANIIESGEILVESNNALGSTAGGTTVEAGAVLALGGDVSVTEDISIAGSGISTGGAIANSSGTNTLNWGVTLNSNAAIGVSAGALTISGAIGGGANTLTKIGAGVLDLAGTNTYTGTTTVDDGTLLVDGTVAGDVTVTSGTLGGTGSINGTAVNVDGGHLNPGPVDGTGTLSVIPHVGTDVSFSSSSTFDVDINGTSAYDSIVYPNMFGGVVTISPNDATLAVHLGYLPSIVASFTIATTTGVGGSLNVAGTFNNLDDGSTLDVPYNGVDVTFQIHYQSSGIVLTVTEETYTWSGGSTDDSNWSDGDNWVGGVAPTPGAGISLIFPASAARKTNNNNLGDGSEFDNITINALGYNLGGDSIDLDGDITAGFALGTSTISNDIALQSTRTVDVPTGGKLSLSGAISGTGYGLTLNGGGTLEFAGASANTYTGTTTVNSGTLELDKSGSDYAIAGDLVLGDNIDAATVQYDAVNQIADTSTVTLNEGAEFDLDGFTEVIGSLEMTGATVTMTTGLLVIADGITTSNSTVTPDLASTIQGGTLDLDSNATFALSVARDTNLTTDLSITSIIADGGITKSGAGVVAFSGANTYGGDTHVNAGVIQVEDDDAFGDTEGVTFVASGASVVFASSSLSVDEDFSIAGTGVSSHGALWVASGDATLSGGVTMFGASQIGAADGATLALSGVLDDGGSFYILTVTNGAAGRTILGGDNTRRGPTTVTAGYLRAANDNALGDPTSSETVTVQGGATLELSGGITIPSLKDLVLDGIPVSGASKVMSIAGDNAVLGDITLSSNNQSVDVANDTTLTLAGVIGGSVNLDKNGPGTLVLSGNNLMTGQINVDDGTLIVTGSITASSLTFVDGILGGSGLAGSISVSSIGTLAPGDALSTALLTAGSATMTGGSTFGVDLDGANFGTGYDQLRVFGDAILGNATLHVSLGFTPFDGEVFTIIDNRGSNAINGTFNGQAEGSTIAVGLWHFQISYVGGEDGHDVTLTAIAPTYTWSGLGGDNNWSTAANWVGNVVPTPGANLIFPSSAVRRTNNDDLSAGFNVSSITTAGAGYTISGNAIDLTNGIATTTWGTVTFGNDIQLQQDGTFTVDAGGTLALPGAISGATDGLNLTKDGAGTLEFAGTTANTYSGQTNVDAGTLLLDKSATITALPGFVFVGTDGTPATLQIGAREQIADFATVYVGEGSTFDVHGFQETVSSLDLKAADVLIGDDGELDLSGQITTEDPTSVARSNIEGGTLDLKGNSSFTITVANDSQLTSDVELVISSVITDGGIVKMGTGDIGLLGDNTYDGTTIATAGMVVVNNDHSLGSAVGGTVIIGNATILFDAPGLTIAEPFSIGGAGTAAQGVLYVASGDDATLTGDVTLNGKALFGGDDGTTLTIDGVVDDGGNAYDLTIGDSSTGRTILAGDNTWQGNLAVLGGYVRATNDNAFGLATASTTITAGYGGSIELSGGISIPSTKSLATQYIGANTGADDKIINVDGDNTFGGDIQMQADTSVGVASGTTLSLSGDISQTGSLRALSKDGTGTLVLSGTGNYTGFVIINAGTAQVDGDFSGLVGATVNSGATLSGTGSMAMPVVMAGGIVAPGDGGPGTLNTGPLNTTTGSVVTFDIDGSTAGTGYSQLVATGGVYLYDATLTLDLGYTPSIGTQFTLINNVTAGAVGGTFHNLAQGATITLGNVTFTISYTGGTGNDVVLTTTDVTYTWSGLGGDNNWSTAANWVGDVVPTPGARLIFPSSASRLSNVDDLADGFDVYGFTIAAAGYTLSGNPIDLGGDIDATYATGTSSINIDLDLVGISRQHTTLSGGDLHVGGALSGSNAMEFHGTGVATLDGTGANTNDEIDVLGAGLTLVLDKTAGTDAVASNLYIGQGAAAQLGASDQVGDGGFIEVDQGSSFSLNGFDETIDMLQVHGSTVDIPAGSTLTVASTIFGYTNSIHTTGHINGPGTLDLDGNSSLVVYVSDDPNLDVELEIGATIADGGIDKSWAGTLALGGDNTYGGTTYIQQGTVIAEGDNALGDGTGDVNVTSGTSLWLEGDSISIANPLYIRGDGVDGRGALFNLATSATVSGNIGMENDARIGAADGTVLDLTGVIDDFNEGYLLTIDGDPTGLVILDANNTTTGDIDVVGGTLEATHDNSLGAAGTSSTVTLDDGASLEFSGGISTPSSKSLVILGAGANSGADDKIINEDGDNAFGGDIQLQADGSVGVSSGTTLTLSGDISETGSSRSLNKDSSGTLILSGTGTFTGVITVNGGTALVDGDFSAVVGGATVNTVATMGGTGLASTINVDAGGTLAPGDSGPGALTATGVDLALDAIYSAEIDGTTPGTDYSQLQVNGLVTLGGANLTLNIGDSFRASAGDIFTLIDNDGLDAVSGIFHNLPQGTIFAADGQAFQISYTGGNSNDVTLTAIPIAVTPVTLPAPAVGSTYSEQLSSTDGSGTGYTYTATGLPDGLSISTSGLITGTPTTANATPVTVEVTVTDSIGSTTTESYSLVVNQAISATPASLPTPTAGSAYSQQLTGTGGSGTGYTYSSTDLPAGLSISTSGLITGTPTTADATPVTVHVTVSDGNGMSAEKTYSVTVNQALALSPSTPPAAAVSSAYSLQIGATGGSGSGYTYEATGLPPGLSISPSGLITGTPTDNTGSPYTAEVTVTDGNGAAATLPLVFAVENTLSITPSVWPSSGVGMAYSQQLTGTGGSGAGYTYTATGLPPGLSISPSGLVSGTPTTVTGSPFNAMVTITDGAGHSRVIPFSVITVAGDSTTSLASSANSAVVGQSFTLTATIAADQVGSVIPDGGTVTFMDGATLLGTAPVSGGVAQFLVLSLSSGSHSLTATFSGNDDFQSSTSSVLSLNSLYPAASTFTVTGTGSTTSPPITFALAVASQEGQIATGTVQFFDGSTLIGTASLDSSGTATFSTSQITPGSHMFTAVYAGDGQFVGSTSSQTFAVGKAQTQTGDVSSSAPQVFYGQEVALTATFTAIYNGTGPMTGTVAFYDGTTFLGTATLNSTPPVTPSLALISPAIPSNTQVTGQANLPNVILTVGEHNIRAVYSGDANYAAVTSDTPVSVGVQPATTGTTLAVGPGAAGSTILTASIFPTSPGTPTLTGSVAFYDGDTLLGTAPAVNQVATFNAGILSAEAHNFRAVFSGGAESTSSGSSTIVYTPVANGPTVVSIRRFGRHFQPTYVVLSFSESLDPVRAQDVRNYQLVKLNRRGKPMGGPIRIKLATFDPVANTVTLSFAHRLTMHRRFQVTVLGSAPNGIMGSSGQPLNASPSVVSGGEYVGVMTRRDFAGPARLLPTRTVPTARAQGRA